MRSLFGASAIMLMVFSYIEISSGMDPEDKKGKAVKLFGVTIGETPKKTKELRLSQDGNRHLRLHNHDTGELVDREHTGLHIEGQSAGQIHPLHQKPFAVRPDWNNVPRGLDPEAGVFDVDKPYLTGTSEYQYARDLRKAHLKDQIKNRAAVAEDASNVGKDKPKRGTAQDPKTGRFVRNYDDEYLLKDYHSGQPYRGELFPEISYAGQVDIANKVNKLQNVDTTHPGYAHLAEFELNLSNKANHNLLNQPEYPYGHTHNQEQAHVAMNNPYSFNQGHDGNYNPTPGLPPNTQSSGESGHPYYQGPPWHYGPGYKQ